MIPEFLEKLLINQYGEDLKNKILEGYKTKRNPSLRINSIKTNKGKIKQELEKSNINYKNIDW